MGTGSCLQGSRFRACYLTAAAWYVYIGSKDRLLPMLSGQDSRAVLAACLVTEVVKDTASRASAAAKEASKEKAGSASTAGRGCKASPGPKSSCKRRDLTQRYPNSAPQPKREQTMQIKPLRRRCTRCSIGSKKPHLRDRKSSIRLKQGRDIRHERRACSKFTRGTPCQAVSACSSDGCSGHEGCAEIRGDHVNPAACLPHT